MKEFPEEHRPNAAQRTTPERPTSHNQWSARDVIYRYRGAQAPAVDGVTIDIPSGVLTAVLGPNGSGKSTLLRLLLGVLEPESGAVHFGGRPLGEWSRREMALEVGVVPQEEEINFPITVREVVAMGRYPHLGAMRPEGAADRTAIEAAMERCDVGAFSQRTIQSLSGGERQRVRLARAFAQEPHVLALDEPTRALDMRHEMEILELLRAFVSEGGTAVIVTHNINLAARYADRILMMREGRRVGWGTPGQVLTRERIEDVYNWPIALTAHPGPGPDLGAVQVTPVAPSTPPDSQTTAAHAQVAVDNSRGRSSAVEPAQQQHSEISR